MSDSSIFVKEVEEDGMEEDPFAAVSPSVLSPTRPSEPLRSPPATRAAVEPHQELRDSRSPFYAEPIDSVHLAKAARRSNPSSRSPHAINQPNRRLRPPSNLVNSGMTVGGSSGLGNRSLMGLLGGTRFGMGAFERLGGDLLEEEELADNTRAEFQTQSSLAASLPPPPSVMSSGSGYADEDRDDDDPPPDFTSRAPSAANHNRRSRSTSKDTDTKGDWRGLRLGGGPMGGILGGKRTNGMSAKERALWRWMNVEDLDGFLQEVYLYYVGKGIWAIGLSRLLNLLTVGWVIFFSTFLMGCIDYSSLWTSHHLGQVVFDHCISRFSGLTLILFLSFTSFYFWRVVRFGMGVRKLWEMHEFFGELLEVPENDIQTIPWHALVSKLSDLRSTHPSALSSLKSTPGTTSRTATLDAHDVANRIMREENYLIALFNKDVVDISVPIPAALRRWFPERRGGLLTKSLEWNLSFCLIGFLFGADGQVRRAFVSERNRKELVEGLRRRFILMGLINALFAPFIVLYLLMYSFFRYFEEYHKNPSSIGSRQFTQLARWKFREFNELPHLFSQRLNHAHPIAEQYVGQFPKEKTALVSRFIAFLAGSFAAVLILFSIIDPDAFLHFEITPGRTVLFYIGVFGTVLAIARGMVPDENKVVDPEEVMREIVEYTHYLPVEWRGKLHSAEVHGAFGQLFQMKIALFVQEILSVIVTPFVLWYTLPDCAPAIVDFFREFTVHVDGLGYVCSFAVFDFKRHGDTRFGAPVQVQDDRWKSNEGKMEKSFLNFTAQNPAWIPRDQTQSLFLSKMTEVHSPSHPHYAQLNPHPAPHPRRPSASTALSPNRLSNRSLHFGINPRSPDDTERPTDVDKSRLYDRAFKKSTRQNGNVASSTVRGRTARDIVLEEEPIDEASALDGESFIAPTTAQPFGLSEREEEERMGEIADEGPSGGIMGLMGAMYDNGTKRW